jgi:hypothetical protein
MAARWKGGPIGPLSGLGRPAWAHFGPARDLLCPVLLPESSRVFPQLHVGPCRNFLFGLDEAPFPARFDNFLTGSSEFSIFMGLVLGHLGVMFTPLLDLYRASRSCHEVLNELIPEVLLSTLKSYISTKLQILHKLLLCSELQQRLDPISLDWLGMVSDRICTDTNSDATIYHILFRIRIRIRIQNGYSNSNSYSNTYSIYSIE